MPELENGQEPKNEEIVPLGEVDSKTSKDSTIEDLPTALKEIDGQEAAVSGALLAPTGVRYLTTRSPFMPAAR